MTQAALGDLIGAEQPVVGRWLAEGGPLPAGKYLVRLPTALGVSGHWLLTGQGPMAPPTAGEAAIYERGIEEGRRQAAARVAQALVDYVATRGAGAADLTVEEVLAADRAVSEGTAAEPPMPPAAGAPRTRRRPA